MNYYYLDVRLVAHAPKLHDFSDELRTWLQRCTHACHGDLPQSLHVVIERQHRQAVVAALWRCGVDELDSREVSAPRTQIRFTPTQAVVPC